MDYVLVLAPLVADCDTMGCMRAALGVGLVASATAVVTSGFAVVTVASGSTDLVAGWEPLAGLLDLVSVTLGWLVVRQRPTSPVGPALAWIGAASSGVRGVEVWGLSADSADPWWGANAMAYVGPGVWPWQLLGFFALVLVFPSGPLPGRAWTLVAWGDRLQRS